MRKVFLKTLPFLVFPCLLAAKNLPVEYFFQDPTFRSVKLSPDGKHLAVLVRYQGIMNLGMIDLETNQPSIITLEKQDISQYHWINNERLIYMTDKVTDTKYERTGGIFAINLDGSKDRVLLPPVGNEREYSTIDTLGYASYLGPHPKSDKHILVASGERSRRYPDVYSINIYKGGNKRFFINEFNARYFSTDINDEIRFAFQTELVGKTIVHFLNPDTKKWEVLVELPETDASWVPLDFCPDRDTFLVETNLERDRMEIIRFNWRTLASEPVYKDDYYDVNANRVVLELKKQDEVKGLYYDAQKPKSVFFCPQHEKLQEMLDSALPETFNQILDVDDSGKKILVLSSSDRQMPTYYLLNLDGFQMTQLTNVAPWMKKEDLQPKQPFAFTASDGREIHGYIVLPPQYEEGKPVPLVVNPHGGPWARDYWRLSSYFSNEPQFYANRGFATIQVNFRGSSGFGQTFMDEHVHDIERMMLDTVEAAEWAVEQGYVHPDRIGIAGASWGGYKTMLCMVKRPDLFKFGINLFGVVDLNEHVLTYLEWNRPTAYDYWVERFGDPKEKEGKEYLEQWSPLTHIENISGPVFIYHGVRDLNVDIEQSRMLMSALDRIDSPYKKLIDSDEMHSIENPELRMELYTMIDDFLMPFRKQWGLVQ
jgi:dipeptidyl aminopeptidase/acylaminoacyl peptidase